MLNPEDIAKATKAVTGKWTRQRRAEERNTRLSRVADDRDCMPRLASSLSVSGREAPR